MAWIAVNSTNHSAKPVNSDNKPNKPTNIATQKPLSTASKYRINVLAAAERLVANIPRKQTTASTKTQKAASAQVKKSRKVIAIAEQNSTAVKRTRKRKRSIDSDVSVDKSTCSIATRSNAKATSSMQPCLAQISSIPDTVSLSHDNGAGRDGKDTLKMVDPLKPSTARRRSTNDWEHGTVMEPSVNSSGGKSEHGTAARHAGQSRLETTTPPSSVSPVSDAAIVDQPMVPHNLDARSVIELSSDDSLSFQDDFDEAIFDDNSFTLPTPQTTISSISLRALPSTEDVASSPTPNRHPNGAPYPAFMHPCPPRDNNDLAACYKQTCFRAADFHRLVRIAQSNDRLKQEYDINVQLFATVNRINYANSLGRGQGVVFTDCFFPDKPPFITTISKIPYSARDLMSRGQKSAITKKIFKANVWIQARSPAGRVARRMQYEIVDITPTSWEEIMEAKRMIEKDKIARQSATTTKEEIDRGMENKDTKAREEFSDPDLDEPLPELFELFRSGGR